MHSQYDILPCFPLYPPLEIFYAFGYCPIVVWNVREYSNSPHASATHLQNFVCSVARDLLDMLCNPQFTTCTAFFAYNACDTLRNLPEIVQSAFEKRAKPAPRFLHLHIPASGFRFEHQREYFALQMQALIKNLESLKEMQFSREEFSKSVRIYQKVRESYQKAQAAVADGLLSYREFSETVARCSLVSPNKQCEIFETLLQRRNITQKDGIPIVISGILPPPREVIEYIEDAGLRICVNDIASEGRSFDTFTPLSDDPIEYYMKFYENHHPCSTLHYTADRRIDELLKKAQYFNAHGFIFIGTKFCEYEYFEIVYMEEQLARHGIHMLKLEFSPDDAGNYAQLKTRIDAFAELLKEQRFGNERKSSSQKN
ncbi:MAG: 2-hydroxyacyl-CoA dehydratase family protein [Spirochaetes bacterium]|nr:2-hydroxyacyl-CoA dehydratase family protein [Spirochaetota bacterium]